MMNSKMKRCQNWWVFQNDTKIHFQYWNMIQTWMCFKSMIEKILIKISTVRVTKYRWKRVQSYKKDTRVIVEYSFYKISLTKTDIMSKKKFSHLDIIYKISTDLSKNWKIVRHRHICTNIFSRYEGKKSRWGKNHWKWNWTLLTELCIFMKYMKEETFKNKIYDK